MIAYHTHLSRGPQIRDLPLHVGIGVTVGEASSEALSLAEDRLRRGGRVMLDNGAFGAWKRGTPLDAQAFRAVLRIFTRFVGLGRGPLLVAPDVVGAAVPSTALRRELAAELRDLAQAGAEIVVPLHEGLPAARAFVGDLAAIDGEPLVPGIPCVGKSAMPIADIVRLARFFAGALDRVHFLGGLRPELAALGRSLGVEASGDSGQAAIRAAFTKGAAAGRAQLLARFASEIEVRLARAPANRQMSLWEVDAT